VRSKRLFTAVVAAATVSLVATACAAPDAEEGDGGGGDSDQPTSLNLGWNQPFYSYNNNTSNGNATANANIKYLMNEQFWLVDAEGNLVENTSFGTYEATSEDPLVVEYQVNEETTWSDGVPVDAADMLLWWAAGSTQVNTVDASEVRTDEATGLADPRPNQVFFDTSSAGLPFVTETPEISEDGKGITLSYDDTFADWQYDMDIPVPAHVVAMEALNIDDPMEAKETLITAIQENDSEVLAPVSQFWNTGFDYTSMPENEALALSNGAYVMTDMQENQFVTLEANDDYQGERPASIDTLTVRWNEDPLAQVQALENGEIDMFSPQVTVDVADAAEEVPNVEIETGVEGTYEHVDLVFNNGGPFDPASYGGDEDTALAVRQAFLAAMPRNEIVERLIVPIVPDATPRNSFVRTQGTPGYDEIVAENGSDEYAETDVQRATQLLEEAGVDTPIDVRMMYAADNVRRANQFQIMQPALAEAGFNLIDGQDPEWSAKLGDGSYDSVFFGWQSTTPAVSADGEIFGTGGLNNLNGYSNPEVDELFDQLNVTADLEEQVEIQTQIEQILFEDAVGITLYQFPAATFSDGTRVTGLEPAVLSPTMFYGFWNWEVPS
jgi:peptide/nickel transport system substrate-binding protein